MSVTTCISCARQHPYSLPFRHPLQTARGVFTQRRGILLELCDIEGRRGYGDIAPWPGFSDLTLEMANELLAAATDDHLIGRRFASLTDLRRIAQLGLPSEVTYGIETALFDLLARAHGQRIAQMLHTAAGASVPVAASVASVADARIAVAAGYAALKVKLVSTNDVERLHEIRGAVGTTVALRVDANGCLTDPRFLEQLKPLGLEWLEQPMAPQEYPQLSRWTGRGIPIAVDESVGHAIADAYDLDGAMAAVAAADLLILKPMFVGGLCASWDLARRAAPHQRVVVSCAWESAVGRAAAAQLAAALGGDTPAGLDSPLAEDVATLDVCDGWLELPQGGGLGVVPEVGARALVTQRARLAEAAVP